VYARSNVSRADGKSDATSGRDLYSKRPPPEFPRPQLRGDGRAEESCRDNAADAGVVPVAAEEESPADGFSRIANGNDDLDGSGATLAFLPAADIAFVGNRDGGVSLEGDFEGLVVFVFSDFHFLVFNN
jgi:hypothetical protein